MKDFNKIMLVGRLGADPVLRATKTGGVPVLTFPVATSRRVNPTDEGTERKEETQWHRIVVWGKQAEHCFQYLGKGQAVFIEGSLRSRKYESKDGRDRIAFEVHADNVTFFSPPRKRDVPAEDAVAVVEELSVAA